MQYEVISRGWILLSQMYSLDSNMFLLGWEYSKVVLINLEAIPANFSAKIDRGTQRSLD